MTIHRVCARAHIYPTAPMHEALTIKARVKQQSPVEPNNELTPVPPSKRHTATCVCTCCNDHRRLQAGTLPLRSTTEKAAPKHSQPSLLPTHRWGSSLAVQHVPDGHDVWVVRPQSPLLNDQGTLQQRPPNSIMALQHHKAGDAAANQS